MLPAATINPTQRKKEVASQKWATRMERMKER
jgi:hypothetical protein